MVNHLVAVLATLLSEILWIVCSSSGYAQDCSLPTGFTGHPTGSMAMHAGLPAVPLTGRRHWSSHPGAFRSTGSQLLRSPVISAGIHLAFSPEFGSGTEIINYNLYHASWSSRFGGVCVSSLFPGGRIGSVCNQRWVYNRRRLWAVPVSPYPCFYRWPVCDPTVAWSSGYSSGWPLSGLMTIDPWTGWLVPMNVGGCGGLPSGFGRTNISVVVGSTTLPLAPNVMGGATELRPALISDGVAVPDPRLLDVMAPPNPPEQVVFPADPALPLLEEFPVAVVSDKVGSPLERVESLLQQTLGDQAYRHGDYAAAGLAYEVALQRTPRRAAVWFRLMLLAVAREEPGEAVQYLKAALSVPADGSQAWVTAADVYGPAGADSPESLRHSQQLWEWLAKRPLSADRLLLLGTFQRMRGYTGVAEDLLSMASHEGAEAERVQSVRRLAETSANELESDRADLDGKATIELSEPEVVGPAPELMKAEAKLVSSKAPNATSLPRGDFATEGIVLRGKRKQRPVPAE